MVAEPIGQFGIETHLGQIVDDRLLEVIGFPTDGRVIRAGVVVGAPIIHMFADAAPFELATDAFARDRLAAVFAPNQAARQRDVSYTGSAVAAMKYVLAGVKRGPVDQSLVASLEDLPVPMQFPYVKAIAENVRERCTVEPVLAVAEDVAFALQQIG